MNELVVNMSEPREKALILNHVRELEGMHRVCISKYRQRRTDRQNRYYWPCFVQPFGEFLRSQGNTVSDNDAHEILKWNFLRRTIVREVTGESLEFTQSTTALDTKEFNQYLDQCAAFLLEYAAIVVPDPDIYHAKDAA